MPRITVVMPVYNHAPYIHEALQSILAQTYTDFHVVAVDDGSTDGSIGVLEIYDSLITILRSPHRGPAAARNVALAASDSEYVAFMDADDVCIPERFALQLHKIVEESTDLTASALTFINAWSRPLAGSWTCPPHARNDYWGSLLERNWIGTPSVMLRRRVFDDAGFFDEDFTHAEDYDLWLRIGREHSISYVESPLIRCRRHTSNTSINVTSHQEFEKKALQKVAPADARNAFNRLYSAPQQCDEAWIWFLLRSGNPDFWKESEAALERHSDSRDVRFARGVFQYDSGHYEDALSIFRPLKDLDATCLNNFAVVSALCGDFSTATAHLEAAVRFRPDYHDAQTNLTALRNGRALRLTRRTFRDNLVPMFRHLSGF